MYVTCQGRHLSHEPQTKTRQGSSRPQGEPVIYFDQPLKDIELDRYDHGKENR